MIKFKTLYKKDKNNNLQEWTVIASDNGYYVTEGLTNGKLTTTEPHLCEAKNTGKKNETTAIEQALKEAQAKYDNKLEHGYSETKAGAETNEYLEPMLAKQYDDYKEDVTFPVCIDDKLNGVRCNAKASSVKSRKGKPFNTIPHIEKSIAPLFVKYPNLFLDGELFNKSLKNHLNRLIEVASVAYKISDLTPELLKESESIVQFHIYDGYGFEDITMETPFIKRRQALKKLLKDIKYVYVLDYKVCNNDSEVQKLLIESEKNKDEGIIIRWGDCPYEHKRSKFLLKLKNMKTDEFTVEEIQMGNGSWSNIAKRIVLKLPKPVIGRDDKPQTTFAAGIEGTQEHLKQVWIDRAKYINGKATVKYQGLSEYGVPQIPVVEVLNRNYE